MSQLDDIEQLKQRVLLTSRIITFALIGGVVAFGAVAFVIGSDKQPGDMLIAYMAAGFSVLMLVLRSIVPAIAVAAARDQQLKPSPGEDAVDRDQAESKLCQLFQTRQILRNALPEGAAFFCLVAYIITVQWWLYAIVFVLIALMVFSLQTRAQLDHWIDDQMQLLELSS